jgi:DNA-binding response OmpR family regulator
MRVLIIEDDKDLGSLLKSSLEAEYFSVDLAEDGEKGSMLGRVNDYDLIILDNILPKKTGLQVCQDIREKGRMVPILVLSVESEMSKKVYLLNSGADDYLTKPFSLEELLARVRALLRRPRDLNQIVLQIEGLTIDTVQHIVTRGGKEVYLTRKEFELLEYLLKNQGKVLSRGMIMEHVWDMNADPFSNTIETHILNLRRKVDSEGRAKLIHTVPGRGYKMELKKEIPA